jgi:L-threonylcarbamoyladenylate synthase
VITSDLAVAVACLRSGGLVGMPTETVYGLAADAENPAAVARIYTVKARPPSHPLIVHVSSISALNGPQAWARDVPDYALRLADRLWPGPLTLVLPRSARAGDHVTGGGESVGLRCPAHPVAVRLLAAFAAATGRTDPGLAAPSANRFGRVSPTRAEDVLAELGPHLVDGRDCVLDGGSSEVGIESTILDCTGPAPALLRPGAVGPQVVERIGGVALATAPEPGVRAPGTLAAHYAPSAEVVLAVDAADAARLLVLGSPDAAGQGLIAPAGVATPPGVIRLGAPPDAEHFARMLYAALREADRLGLHRVVAIPPDDAAHTGLSAAVTDRLRRAAASASAPTPRGAR